MAWTRSPIGFAMLLTLVLAAPPAAAANPTTDEACALPNIVCARGTLSGALAYCEGNYYSWTCYVDWTLGVVTRGPQSCGRASTAGPTVPLFCSVLGNTASSTSRLTYVNAGSADLSGTVCSAILGSAGEQCTSIPVASVPLPPPPPPPSGGGSGGAETNKHGGPNGKAVGYNGNGPKTGIRDLDGLVSMGIAYLP